jgi:hypothetical protein
MTDYSSDESVWSRQSTQMENIRDGQRNDYFNFLTGKINLMNLRIVIQFSSYQFILTGKINLMNLRIVIQFSSYQFILTGKIN